MIREDRGPIFSNLVDMELHKEGDYVFQFSRLPIPLTIYKWRDSVTTG